MISEEVPIPHKPGVSLCLQPSGLAFIQRKKRRIWLTPIEIEITTVTQIPYELLEALLLSGKLENRQKIKLPENARKLPINAIDNFSRAAMLYQLVSFTLEKIVSFMSKVFP